MRRTIKLSLQRENYPGPRGLHTGTTGVLGPGSGAPGGSQSLAAGYSNPRSQNGPVVPVCKINGCKISRFALELFYILKKGADILLWAVEEED